jgi:hypothetical protein
MKPSNGGERERVGRQSFEVGGDPFNKAGRWEKRGFFLAQSDLPGLAVHSGWPDWSD